MEKLTIAIYKDSKGCTMAHGIFEPGFKWSEHAKPFVGTDSCQVAHTGYVVTGAAVIRDAAGQETTVKKGDFYHVEPGHDSWVVGNEKCEMIDFLGAPTLDDSWKDEKKGK